MEKSAPGAGRRGWAGGVAGIGRRQPGLSGGWLEQNADRRGRAGAVWGWTRAAEVERIWLRRLSGRLYEW